MSNLENRYKEVKLDKKVLLRIINQISQIIIENCETAKDVEEIEQGVKKYMAFLKSVRGT